ncbi:MAG: hypothetical protein WD469_09995 [Paenibacillaceae bacterium]
MNFRKILSVLLIFSFFLSYFKFNNIVEANTQIVPWTTSVSYTTESDNKRYSQQGTANINYSYTVPTGQLITGLDWYAADGTTLLRSASGVTFGGQSISGSDTLTGYSITVKTDIMTYDFGSLFYWDRYGYSNADGGLRWYPGGGSSFPSSDGHGAPTQNYDGNLLPRYPNQPGQLSSTFSRNSNFVTTDTTVQVSKSSLVPSVLTFPKCSLNSILNVPTAHNGDVTSNSGNSSGVSCSSTDLDKYTVNWTDQFNNDQYGTDFSNPGAKQLVYVHAFDVQMQSKTYRYDQILKVTYGLPGATPTPIPVATATPTPDSGATATPTPIPTPAPTCSTPVTINVSVPGSAKEGETFYVSASGSKDSSGGTNLSYQWYYQASSGGSLVIGSSTRDATFNLTTLGTYTVYLGIVDIKKPICSAQTSKSISITPPKPDADIVVKGSLKINRPLVLDSTNSSSPSAYPITSRNVTITPLNGAISTDVVTLQPLSGTVKIDTMLRKAGDYNISVTICNTLSLCDTKTIKITIANDLNPLADIQGGASFYRDPLNANKAMIILTASLYSIDSDNIGSSSATIVYDKNNDGNFADDLATNSFPGTLNIITGKLTFNATSVGKYMVILYGCETFDPGPFASYLTTADYKCTDPGATFTTLVNNQAPTTSLTAQKTYKTDIALNVGDISTADRNYIINNITSWTATLRAKGIDANITTGIWNKNFEPDYLKDTGSFLTTMNWRANLDKKYLIGITNTTTRNVQGSLSVPLDLKPIPISSVPFEGKVLNAKATGKNVYMVYQNPMGQSSDYSIFYASGSVGNMTKQSLGYQYTSANTSPYNAWASVMLDTNQNPYTIVSHDPSNTDNVFHQGYHLFYPSQGIWDKRLDVSPASYDERQPTQIFSRMSNMKTGPTIWSTAGIFYIDTWIQSQNFFRRPSNNWVPNTYPDYYSLGSQQLETYSVGYTVNNNDYWFGTYDYNQNYLFLNYNGIKTYFNQYNSVSDGVVSGNSVIVFAYKRSDASQYKLTFTNGLLVNETKLNIPTNNTILKINPNTGKLYMLRRDWDYELSKNKDSVIEFDYVNNTVVWTKSVPSVYSIQDVSFDSDGITPLYLFSSSLTNMIYLSKDGDTGSFTNDTLISKSEANATASYNENGEYAWFTAESKSAQFSNNTELYKIHKVDPDGIYSNATILKPSTMYLFGLKVLANNDVVAMGMDTALGYFYALESEDYVKHYSKPLGFSSALTNSQYNQYKVYLDVNDHISFTNLAYNDNGYTRAYNVNLITRTLDYVGSVHGTNVTNGTIQSRSDVVAAVPINSQIHVITMDTTFNTTNWQGTVTVTADGINIGSTFNSSSVGYNDSSIDANSSNQFFATVTLSQGQYRSNFFATNLPGFTTNNGYLDQLASFFYVKVKFINNIPYIYGRRTASSNIEIYSVGMASGHIKTTFIGYLQNTNVFPTGWVGHSNYVYSGSYTNLPTAKTDAGIESYTIPTNFDGTDSYLRYGNIRYDNLTGGFSTINSEWTTVQTVNGIFYDAAQNKYVKQVFNVPQDSSVSKFSYSNGCYYFGLLKRNLFNGNYYMNSVSMYKMDKNGTSNIYNFTAPDPTASIYYASFAQDEDGYTYGIILNGSTTYIVTNKSGAFKTYTYSLGGSIYNLSDLSISNGKFIFGSAATGTYGRIYYMDVANISTSSSFISKSISASNVSTIKNLQYDPDSNTIFFEGYNYRGSSNNPQWNSLIFGYDLGDTNYYINQFGYGDNFVIDKNNIFIADNATLYKYNKFDFQLLDVGRKAPVKANGLYYYALNSRGKIIGLSYDNSNKAIVTVYNSIDISQTDPSLSTMIGGQTISSVFVGPQKIQPDVNYVVQLSKGQFMDSSQFVNTQAIMDSLTNYMNTNIKQQAGATVYYLLGDPLNLTGVYSDYESDPKQAEKYKLYHAPSGFDNNQGIIANNGQNQITPLILDHVGSYTGYYIAQDNPTFGNAALAPFSKWSSEDTPIKFIVHRKPFAVFNVALRDDPSDAQQVFFSISEASYDLDHNITDTLNKGIVNKQYMYKDSSTATWINGLPPSILPKNVSYDLVLTVTDIEGATAKASTTFFTGFTIPNNLPVTNITNIISTDANNPDILQALTPNYQWSYADPDGDPQQKYILNIYNSSNAIISTSNEIVSSAKTYTQATNLVENVVYSVQVQANDGFGYGALSPKKYFKIITNRPPTGNLTFVTPIYEHDTPIFTISQSDPDGDALTIAVEASFNGGAYTTIANWNVILSGTTKIFNYGALAQGSYTLRLKLDDGKGGVFTQTFTFTALPLTLNGAINHTAIWESNRLNWNMKYPLQMRDTTVFWAGEALELSSTVTSTGTSPTKPVKITATLIQSGDKVALASSDQIHFLGEMINSDFVHSLSDGAYTMRFDVNWSNGLTQTTDVPFQIKGNILDVIVVQLRN